MYELIQAIVGRENFSRDDFELWCYSRDAGSILPRRPGAVAMIRTVENLVDVMKTAYDYGKPVIARGASSSMCGAPNPVRPDTLMLDLTTLQGIEVDEDNLVVKAGAGVTWAELNTALAGQGWELGLEGPWSAPSATVGGTLAVHAICMGAAKYGSLGTQVMGLEVVLSDGTVVKTGSAAQPANDMIMRDCNGADLTGLFLGSHGTLGIITKAALKMYPLTRALAYGAFAFASLEAATEAIHNLAKLGILYDLRLFTSPVPPEIGGKAGLVFMIKSPKQSWTQELLGEATGCCLTADGQEIPKFGEEFYQGRNHARVKAFGKAGPGWLEVAGFVPIRNYPACARPVLEFFQEKDALLKQFGIRWSLGGLLELRALNIPMALFCNEKSRAAWEKMLAIWLELAEIMFAAGVSPYWIGHLSPAIMPRLGNTYTLYQQVKNQLDPKNILNPDML